MGNHKFRLSDMIPNAWFYKLRDMSKTKTSSTTTNKNGFSSSTSTAPKHQNHHHQHYQFSQPRNSFYYTPRADQFYNSPKPKYPNISHFPDPPRKSSKRSRTKRKSIYKPSPRCHPTTTTATATATALNSFYVRPNQLTQRDQDLFLSPTATNSPDDQPNHHCYESPSSESTQSFNGQTTASWSTSCSCRVSSSGAHDIIIDVNDKSYAKKIENSHGCDLMSEMELLQLPPIVTKPKKSNHPPRNTPRLMVEKREETHSQSSVSIKIVKENCTRKETVTPARRSVSGGVKLRSNSPKITASKRISQKSNNKSQKNNKKSFSESFAIVKSSFDPQKDFRESMVEMIVENNIRASKDLEELLACYLSLNSNEYHDLIVKAFEQIWFSLPDF